MLCCMLVPCTAVHEINSLLDSLAPAASSATTWGQQQQQQVRYRPGYVIILLNPPAAFTDTCTQAASTDSLLKPQQQILRQLTVACGG